MSVRAVFLDRDGTMNVAVARDGLPYGSPRSRDELEMAPDAETATARLREAGFVLFGITNQPEVSRGQVSRAMVETLNATVAAHCGVTEMFVCWHDDPDGCDCRKPKPGLILQAAAKHDVDLPRSFVVGDRCKDAEAAQAAGCRAVIVDQGWAGECTVGTRVRSLGEAVDWILAQPA